jgi:hypothetical protein
MKRFEIGKVVEILKESVDYAEAMDLVMEMLNIMDVGYGDEYDYEEESVSIHCVYPGEQSGFNQELYDGDIVTVVDFEVDNENGKDYFVFRDCKVKIIKKEDYLDCVLMDEYSGDEIDLDAVDFMEIF